VLTTGANFGFFRLNSFKKLTFDSSIGVTLVPFESVALAAVLSPGESHVRLHQVILLSPLQWVAKG
jgi:hypothetical protein